MEIETTPNGALENWDAKEAFDAYMNEDVIIIDVRTPQEYLFERIDGALLAPMQAFRPSHLPDQVEKQIILHCGSGVRSKRVAEMCLEAGLEKIAHIKGGFAAWKEAKLPFIGTDMGSGAPKVMQMR